LTFAEILPDEGASGKAISDIQDIILVELFGSSSFGLNYGETGIGTYLWFVKGQNPDFRDAFQFSGHPTPPHHAP
jgi:hypothetical protein